MKTSMMKLVGSWGIGAKVAAATFAMVGVVFFAFVLLVSLTSARQAQDNALREVSEKTQLLSDTIDIVDANLRKEVATFARVLDKDFSAGFTLDDSKQVLVGTESTPTLLHQGQPVNLDFSVPDRFTALTGVYVTVFVRRGDEFIRITTSHKKENGERAIGTLLDHAHPAYKALTGGRNYAGPANLFGGQYMTQYDPIRNARGELIGILYVGVNFTDSMRSLKEKVLSIQLGETGYFYALNSKEGKDQGKLIMARQREGDNVLERKDEDGNAIVKMMLAQKQGTLRYRAASLAGGEVRERLVSFRTIAAWNMLVVGETDKLEVTQATTDLERRFALIGLLMVALVAGLLYPLVRAMVTRPLAYALQVARTVAAGDLTSHIEARSGDEIGQLMDAMRDMNTSLARIVGQVRSGTDTMADASSRIAAGNAELSSRTEKQASSLERTASAMEQLTGTVQQNADNARQANQLAISASDVALRGGKVVADVVTTMESINDSSRKIADIIGVIDSIAFQTNILALNAAVEAARAGEQGRGFAVVAAEVRNLAQRSAGAAREIKDLINASVDKVTLGTRLVANAGGTMEDIVGSVRDVTAIMAQIMAASQEQALGIAQVNQAVGDMDAATQQNAVMVGASVTAANTLEEQAAALAQVVTIFRIDAVPAPTAVQAAPVARVARTAPPPRRLLKAA